jgi:4-hydroxy-3-polyprenylbenzoate decarboxylase
MPSSSFPSSDLRGFIAELERRKLLKRIAHPVSAKLEITEIADRIIKHGRPGAAL